MSITNSKFIDDRVRAHYTCKRCKRVWDKPDFFGSIDVSYDSILTAPSAPTIEPHAELPERGSERLEVVSVPDRGVEIAVLFEEWQGAAFSKEERLAGGPYIVRKSNNA